ncbi:MAG: TolC family protein, partial [Isosphaeraceae bacterium]
MLLALPLSGCVLHRALVPIRRASPELPISPTPVSPPLDVVKGSQEPVSLRSQAAVVVQEPKARDATADQAVTPTAATGPAEKPTDSAEKPADPAAAPGFAPEAIPIGVQYPLDLTTALRLADAENPTIAKARAQILASLALQLTARSLLIPNLNAGVTYHAHAGNLIRAPGRILSVSSQSLYVGGGAGTLAAETLKVPAVNITTPLTEAFFEPLAARQRLAGSRFGASATANAILGEVANYYLELLAAEAILGMQRLSESQTAEIVKLTVDFATAGEGREADAERAKAERTLRRAKVQRAEGDVGIAAAQLAQRLNLDPAIRLRPLGARVEPVVLVDPTIDTETLVRIGVQRRPEVGERNAGIGFAQVKLKEELARPFVPFLWVGFSGGGYGGGSNLAPPNGISNFAGRTDFDVRLFWTWQNFGFGNLAWQRRRRAEVGMAVAEQSRIINLVRREVTTAQAEVLANRNRIEATRRELIAAEDGFNNDLALAQQNLNRPIEVLNNLDLLAEARVKLIRAITIFNQSEFRLFVALGSPPPLGPNAAQPMPPVPVTTPLHGPIASHPMH